MAIINSRGLKTVPFTEHREANRQILKDAINPNLPFPTESPQDMIADSEALKDVRYDEVAAYLTNGVSRQNASREQLIALASLDNISPHPATKTTVTAILYGVPGTVVPVSSRASTDSGDQFELLQDTTIVLTGGVGQVEGSFQAIESGPIEVQAQELINIITVVEGWTRVDNTDAGVSGDPEEDTEEFRERFGRLTARNSLGAEESMEAGISEVPGVTHVQVDSNHLPAEATIFGIQVPSGSVIAVVKGGKDTQIAEAMRLTKSMGAPMVGDTEVTLPGFTQPYRFQRIVDVPVEISVNIVPITNGTRNVTDAAINYIASLNIGDEADAFQLGVFIKEFDSNIKVNAVTYIRKKLGAVDVTAANSVQPFELLVIARADVTVT